MTENLKTRIKEWLAVGLSSLWLALATFFTSYFPAISRYNVSTLFNLNKRGYFDFLFVSLQLKRNNNLEGEDSTNGSNSWVRLFAIILLVCYLFHVVAETFLVRHREEVKKNLRKVTTEKLAIGEGVELTESSPSDKVVDVFTNLFSCLCELFIDLWAVISINRTRNLRDWFLPKTLFCLVVIVCCLLVARFVNERRGELEEDGGFWSLIMKTQQQLAFSELSTAFTMFYFFFFPREVDIINAILLGYNVNSVFSRLRNFVLAIPQTISICQVWWRKDTPHKHYILID